jgi:imidazole glycerol-phosphate synthase subunit HisH
MIAVIDYGAGNLRSISRALQSQGGEVRITSEPDEIRSAERVVLPGVGNAKAAMEQLRGQRLDCIIHEIVDRGTPLLGVCLGMQLLFREQEEGPTVGLDLVPGAARLLPVDHKIPHMGWNAVTFRDGTPLSNLGQLSCYFVHSYAVVPEHEGDIAGTTDYGITFPSVIIRDHVWGTQFHPEKSGNAGLSILKAWFSWQPDSGETS